ncbi:MAG: hypothetical protein EPN23_03885 [Verrucomicrobia bacterium]|nr:MAG: hypothetical protein EPN23_03885 [Verrucomicrobiota bacterium]
MDKNHPAIRPQDFEKYSSALTLSDMEVFIFPELLFSLVLANIMSPKLWAWRDDGWFAGLHKMTPHRRILRLKQFIIDHYAFNLDLDTWGLTTKEREIARFLGQLDEAALAQSNALFGYEGDKYYFDLDIRRHFGLDKYTSNIIPYWKTETVEAMDAFRFKEGYPTGAGECVSLSTLYAAAMFIVCGIPLEDIFLLATPLHSQNFILAGDGVLTNNRRVVTKNMWFNGTELTDKAQRALRHEQITIVSHVTGHIHCVYSQATIDHKAYHRFGQHLGKFLTTEITMEILLNFLRQYSSLQSCFQLRHELNGHAHYIPVEKVYAYEHASSFKVSDATRSKLLDELDEDEFFPEPLENRIVLNKFDEFFKKHRVNLDKPAEVERLLAELECNCLRNRSAVEQLLGFARLEPRLPDLATKQPVVAPPLALAPTMPREAIIAHLAALRATHPVADLAFYAFRDLARCDAVPFLKAALERSPVSIKGAEKMSDAEVFQALENLPNESIYDGTRVAQPDEVWNYRRGDGLERALTLANIWKARHPQDAVRITSDGHTVHIHAGSHKVAWPTAKRLTAEFVC